MEQIFDPTATRAYTAKILRYVVEGPVAMLCGLVIVAALLVEELRTNNIPQVLIACFVLSMTYIILRRFIVERLENDDLPPLFGRNLATLLSHDVLVRLPANSKTTWDIVSAALKSPRGHFILNEMALESERLSGLLKPVLEGQLPVPFIQECLACMEQLKKHRVDPGCILETLFRRPGILEEVLNSLDLSLKDLTMIVEWESYHYAVWRKEFFLSPEGILHMFGGFGRHWITGYNDALDSITVNISDAVFYRPRKKVIIHLDHIKDAMFILGRSTQHNLIVTGQDGCGKRSFVENIAFQLRIAEVHAGKAYTNVLFLNAHDLLSGGKDPDVFLLQALKRADAQGRYILVIEDIGLFLSAGDAKLRSVLTKFLQAKNINVIGVADSKDYHTLIKTDASLDAQFEKVNLEATTQSDSMSVLMEEYFHIEDTVAIHVTYKALKEIVESADRYIQKSAFPGKAIDLLHDVVQKAKADGSRFVTPEDVRVMVSLRVHMQVGEAGADEKDALRNLEESLHRHIVGQEYAITTITNALKRARTSVGTRNRPLGTFLFLGPTGVGKTETAKALAEEYFGATRKSGDKAPMIRLDMNEYSNPESVSAIVGSTDLTRPAEGFLTQQVQDNPFSLILLDEIEKADKKVLNLFLQILDEGHLIDAQGTRTDFRNTIVIATSNAGATFINALLKKNPDPDKETFKKQLMDEVIATNVYSPEFLNRFDEVILYFPLTREETEQVAVRMIEAVVRALEEQRGIIIHVDSDAAAAIAEKGYSTEFGVREMRRVIGDTLETYVADYLLNHPVKRGDSIDVRRSDLHI